jgi:hypothetical protein
MGEVELQADAPAPPDLHEAVTQLSSQLSPCQPLDASHSMEPQVAQPLCNA